MKTGILWDLDGTLLDTLDDLTDGVNYAMTRLGYPCWTRDDVCRFVGNGARRLMEQAVPRGADVEQVLAAFHEYYDVHCLDHTGPYPGISDALERLARKYPVAIVSNKPHVAVVPLCRKYFPGIYALGESSSCPRKPAPDMVLKAMADLGVERCIYVGDSEVDVLTAKNAGVPCLSVLWGFRNRQDLESADATHFCEKTEDLEQIIELMISQMK